MGSSQDQIGVAAITTHEVPSKTMPDLNSSSNIGLDRAVLLASRTFAAFLLFWVVDDITELPRELFSLTHYLRGYTGTGMSVFQALRSSYVVSEQMMYLLANVLHIALWLVAAGWFYRCGPRIRNFFSAETNTNSEAVYEHDKKVRLPSNL